MARGDKPPLCVDLDGTLIKSDLLVESFLRLIKENPLYLFSVLVWLFKGKAHLKAQIAARVSVPVDGLPYNEQVLELISAERGDRAIVLATASHGKYAQAVAEHLGVFDRVFATDDHINLSGQNKADELSHHYGKGGFDYIGNDDKDWPVWDASGKAYLVSGDKRLVEEAKRRVNVARVIDVPVPSLKVWLKAIRIHQWSKNLLLFVPFVLGQSYDWSSFIVLCGCFLCFSFLASCTYILNDLLDLEADRKHDTKRRRPLAAGTIPLTRAVVMMIALAGLTLLLLFFLPPAFAAVSLLYLVVTLSYSFAIKAIPILDVCCLASLYTLRVIGGVLAIDSERSFWLLAFSMFLFLSLALAKRVSELKNLEKKSEQSVRGRGYVIQDISLLSAMGVSSGYLSVLVVAFYINSGKVMAMYRYAEILWLICPLLLYWISYIWLQTSRGNMHEDPIVFALRDWVSRVVMALCGLVLVIAILA